MCVAAPALAQSRGTTLLAGVGDATTGAFLRDAVVSIRGLDVSARSDSLGQARLAGLAAGIVTIDVRRVGYAPLSAPVKLTGRDSMEVVLLMQPSAQTLAPVSVVESGTSRWLSEFDEHRRHNLGGHFITEAAIRKSLGSTIAELVSTTIPGIRVTQPWPGLEARVFSTRGTTSFTKGSCPVAVYLDDVRVDNAAIVPLEHLGGVEYYSAGFVPVRYRTTDDRAACGVMLLWHKP
jgi:hypothetical protein